VNRLTRVLTAIDFSTPARAAFDHALVLSRMHNAELSVVHAVATDQRFGWHAQERIAMIRDLRRAAEAAGVPFKESVQRGEPADVILLHADATHPDVIVLGTHQRSGFERLRLGSVAETVMRRANQPVLIVPASPGGSAAKSVMSFGSILVAADFSLGSMAAVDRALAMASVNSRVTLLHVIPSVSLANAHRYSYHLSEQHQRLLVRDAWRRLQDTILANAPTSRKVHARVVTGDPSTAIARVASDVDADLILVGVTRRGAIGRRIFRSTAARVIRTAGRPVLAIPELVEHQAVPKSEMGEPVVAA
jgi:nucleotide-binding universal stress UspA family protein